MPRRFGRLPFFSRSGAEDRASRAQSAIEAAPIDPDAAPVGPLTLMPAMIQRQVLFDVTEMTPAWLRSRPGPEREPARPKTSAAERVPKSAASTDEPPTSKTTRRQKAVAKPAEPKPAATRRARGPSSGRRTSR